MLCCAVPGQRVAVLDFLVARTRRLNQSVTVAASVTQNICIQNSCGVAIAFTVPLEKGTPCRAVHQRNGKGSVERVSHSPLSCNHLVGHLQPRFIYKLFTPTDMLMRLITPDIASITKPQQAGVIHSSWGHWYSRVLTLFLLSHLTAITA